MDNKSLSHKRWKCQYHIVFICITMVTNDGGRFIILLYLFRLNEGKVWHVLKENLECSLAS